MKKFFASVFVFFCFVCCSTAQLSTILITLQVIPPYSPYLSTYIDQPNKVLITLTNISRVEQQILLRGQITGDNGVSVTTSSGFKPSQPITITGGGSLNISLNSTEARDYFDVNNVSLTGLTKAQLIQNQALPEGNYSICVRAFDYATGTQQLSMEGTGCAFFPVSYIDAPQPVQPICGNDVNEAVPQFALFSWTPPATARGAVDYEFVLKEVPNTLNPYDVIKNQVFPVIYSTTQTSNNTLVYSVSQPKLDTGKKYVWRVKATGTDMQFKNGGYSDACWFVYKEKMNPVPMSNPITISNTDVNFKKPVVPKIPLLKGSNAGNGFYFADDKPGMVIGGLMPFDTTGSLSGKLVYKYGDPGETKEYPLKNANISLQVQYFEKLADGTFKPLPGLFGSAGGMIVTDVNGKGSLSEIAATTKTDASGNFSFTFPNKYPFGNVGTVHTSTYQFDVNGDVHTSTNGGTYKGYVYARILIENPHAYFYTQPVQLFDFRKKSVISNQKVVCIARSEEFQAHLGPKTYFGSIKPPKQVASENLVGVKAYLLRKTLATAGVFPDEDAIGVPDEMDDGKTIEGMDVVASTVTNGQGIANFKKVIHTGYYFGNGQYDYYIYFETNKDDKYHYEFTKPEYLFGSGSAPDYTDKSQTYSFGATSPVLGLLASGKGGDLEEYHYQSERRNWQVGPKMPRIFGRVLDGDNNNKPIEGAYVMLESRYNQTSASRLFTGSYANATELSLQSNLNYGDASGTTATFRSTYTNLGGGFNFTELPIMYDINSMMPIGPQRGVAIIKKGYETYIINSNASNKIKTLYYGEQYPMGEIVMKRQSEVTGRVVDEETGKGLKAYVHMNDDGVSEKTNSMGYFNGVYATKIAGKKQKVVVESEGYLNDTIELEVKNTKHDLGEIKMAKRKRKLVVWVYDAETDGYLQNAKVEVLNVITSCSTLVKVMTDGKFGGGGINVMVEKDCPLEALTNEMGFAYLNFENGGYDNNITYQVRVTGPDKKDYEPFYVSTKIPYSSDWGKLITVKLKPATCISGFVKNSKGEPVSGAKVKMDISVPFLWMNYTVGDIEAESNSNGEFKLHNVPIRDYPQTILVTKPQSQYVGDSWEVITKKLNDFYITNITDYSANSGIYNWSSGRHNWMFGGGTSSRNSKPSTANNTPTCFNHDFTLKELPGLDITKMLGFPIEVSAFTQTGEDRFLSGNFLNINSNEQFKAGEKGKIPFTKILVKNGSVNGPSGKPYPIPAVSPMKTDGWELPMKVFYYNAKLMDDDYFKVQNDNGSGIISGNVKLESTSFNNNDLSFDEDVYVSDPYKPSISTESYDLNNTPGGSQNLDAGNISQDPFSGSGSSTSSSKPVMKVFYGNTAVTKPYATDNGFTLCDKDGKEINFSLVAFPKSCTAGSKSSRINGDNIFLYTTLHTNIEGLSPADMKINIGDLKLAAGKLENETKVYTSELVGKMGDSWSLKSSSWSVGQMGLRLKTGTLFTGIDVPFEDVFITANAVKTDKAKFKFNNLSLMNGKIPLTVTAENKALGYFYMDDGSTRAWQFSAFNSDNTPVAEIKGLDGIQAGQSVKLKNIFLYSNSQPSINIQPSTFNVHEIIAFTPSPKLVVSKTSLKLNGTFITDIPGTGDITSSLFYDESLKVSVDVSPFQFKTGNIYYVFDKVKITNHYLHGDGEVFEPNVLPKLKIDLDHQGLQSTVIKLKSVPENRIQSGGVGGLKNLIGGNVVLKNEYKWGTLHFEGITFGTTGMEGKKMNFDVTGAVLANNTEIGIDNIPTPFGGMKFVYLMPESAIDGSVSIENMKIGGLVLNGGVNARIGSKGWYFKANGNMDIPSLGGGLMYMLIGSYNGKGSELASGIGKFGCLPAEFQNQVKGFLFQASITRNIADISGDIFVLSAGIKANASLSARVYGTFGGNSTYSLGLLANLDAEAYLKSPATCTDISAEAHAEAMVDGTYSVATKTLTLSGCISLRVLGSLYQCIPLSGVCPGGCIGKDVDKSVKIDASIDSNKNFDISMDWGTCIGTACKVD
ncbi:MAG: carboxypeptidase-like regulatory domain-containing protein [Bacteroidota bacterium]